MQSAPKAPPHHQPKRMLSTTAAAAVVMGMVIGAGIFRTPQLVAQSLGGEGALLLAWALGGLFALIGALCYAELSAAYPDTGGDYRFLREAFGGDAAWLFAWSRFAVIFSASGALLAFVGIDYLAELIPMGTFTRALVAGSMVILLTALNLRGVQTGTRAQIAMVAMDVAALLALGGAALWLAWHGIAPQQAGPTPPAPVSLAAFGQSMVFIMLAYGGFNDASTLSAEVRKPRDMTRALFGGMVLITALYMIANWAYVRGLGMAGLARSEAPAAALMARAFGPAGETVIVICVAVAAFSVLNALIIVGGRTLYTAAEDEPALAARRHSRADRSRTCADRVGCRFGPGLRDDGRLPLADLLAVPDHERPCRRGAAPPPAACGAPLQGAALPAAAADFRGSLRGRALQQRGLCRLVGLPDQLRHARTGLPGAERPSPHGQKLRPNQAPTRAWPGRQGITSMRGALAPADLPEHIVRECFCAPGSGSGTRHLSGRRSAFGQSRSDAIGSDYALDWPP